MFLIDPSLRELFPVDLTGQRRHVVNGLVTIIQTVDDPERFDQLLRRFGRDHRKFHVSPEHFGVMGVALLEALRTYAGDRWSIEYDQAWRDAYDAMATKMLVGAEQDGANPPFWHAEVVDHQRRSRDIATFTVRPLMPYAYEAGQYTSLECSYQPRDWRTYSIANAPRLDGTLDFHVRAADSGWVSAALVRRLQVGDIVRLGPPLGSMTLAAESTRDILCIAGGTGLAPVKALVEELCHVNDSRWVTLFVGARDRDDLYDMADLNHLTSRFPWLTVTPVCSDADFDGEQGTVNEAVERHGPWAEHDVFVCGPTAMVRATLGSLSRLGVPLKRVRYDALGSQ
jgi:NAD(P)H-flavin reductase/hemoglobin-like flavoprotein